MFLDDGSVVFVDLAFLLVMAGQLGELVSSSQVTNRHVNDDGNEADEGDQNESSTGGQRESRQAVRSGELARRVLRLSKSQRCLVVERSVEEVDGAQRFDAGGGGRQNAHAARQANLSELVYVIRMVGGSFALGGGRAGAAASPVAALEVEHVEGVSGRIALPFALLGLRFGRLRR